ncbi:MAG: dTDP-4-dehydrorhamnose reductase [Pygmaiobacter massiliensis]|nr:dTDP-4-dehydrorhamnose reductase [Pygmaiobacter massiliensis]
MKLLIVGSNGQLGSELCRVLELGKSELGMLSYDLLGAEYVGYDVDRLDITKMSACRRVMTDEKPDVVINCAAYTNVDGCEAHPDDAFAVNAIGPRNLAVCCEEFGAKLVHISTDYVFPGTDPNPRCEYDTPAPISMYGKTKLLGEEYVKQFCHRSFILRTAWLYGYVGKNFVKTMLRVGRQNGAVTVVNDQLGNPTNAADLAHHVLKLAITDEYGTYHCTGEGVCSWYDFTVEIMRLSGINATVTPCTSEEYAAAHPEAARRPAFSALDNKMLRCSVGDEMRNWKDALASFFENYKEE